MGSFTGAAPGEATDATGSMCANFKGGLTGERSLSFLTRVGVLCTRTLGLIRDRALAENKSCIKRIIFFVLSTST